MEDFRMGPDELELLAQKHFDNGEYLLAKPLYEELIRQAPNWDDGEANYELGLCCEKLGLHAEALEQFYIADKWSPFSSFYLWQIATAELAYGDKNRRWTGTLIFLFFSSVRHQVM